MSKSSLPSSKDQRIAFIQASWHQDILQEGKDSFIEEMTKLGYSADQVDLYQLPRLHSRFHSNARLLQLQANTACLLHRALLLMGGNYRHEFVAEAVISGLMNVQLQTQTPILSMVLTPKKYDGSTKDNEFFPESFQNQGKGKSPRPAIHYWLLPITNKCYESEKKSFKTGFGASGKVMLSLSRE